MSFFQRARRTLGQRRPPQRETRSDDIPGSGLSWLRGGHTVHDPNVLTAAQARYTSLGRALDVFIREGLMLPRMITQRMDGMEWLEDIHEVMMWLEHPNNEDTTEETFGAYGADNYFRGHAHIRILHVGEGDTGPMAGLRYWPVDSVSWETEQGVRKQYRLTVGGGQQRTVDPENMISVKRGISPENPYKGLGMLDAVLPEITADVEIQQAAGRAIHNLGQGILITPDNPGGRWDPEQSMVREKGLENAITGPNVGRVVAFGEQVKTMTFGSKPSDMMFNELQIMMQARVLGVANIASNLLGLQSNIEYETTYAGMELAWKTTVDNVFRPLWRSIGQALTKGLIDRMYPRDAGRWRIVFDESELPTLTEQRMQKVRELVMLHARGVVTAERIAEELGYEYDPPEREPDEPEPEPERRPEDDARDDDEE